MTGSVADNGAGKFQPAITFLAGESEMGARTRAFDWSQTPLGPIEAWPQSLKIAVRIMLDSRYAMWLGWGPEFTFFYNDAYARMTLGPKHPWALGRPARDVWSEIWDDIGPRAESVVQTGQATWDEGLLLFLERSGFPEETYHTFSYSPLPNDTGGIGGMLCVVTEDTERTIGERRLRTLRELAARTTHELTSIDEASELTARTLAENPRDLPFVLIYLLESDSRTARLAALTGLSELSSAAMPRIDLESPSAEGAVWPLRSVLQSGRAEIVTGLKGRFGEVTGGAWPEPPRQAVVLPLTKLGQTQLAGFLVAGTSPRLEFNDAYKGFLELLAGQVATAVMNARAYEEERRRAEALAELDRAKTAFFSNVSHEFRTPLTLMLGPVEDMLARSYTELSPAAKSQLEIVNRNGLRLLRLVNSLLDFSRIEAGRVRAVFQPTDLAAYTADISSMFRAAIERAGLQFHVHCSPIEQAVYIDRDMWEKIVLNLLSNAFKFTFEGALEVELRQVGQTAELTVRDSGTGIPAEEMPRLFERFHRVENARGRTHEGSGIGLALVQELVKLHGGQITAESEPGRGTTFRVSLPLGSDHLLPSQIVKSQSLAATGVNANAYVEEALRWLPGEGPDAVSEEVPANSTAALEYHPPEPDAGEDRPRVLVADDNADMRQYIVRLLAPAYQIEAVCDGAKALASAKAAPPDLILTDVMMPQLDGFGLLREIRMDASTRNIPVIMLSARAGEESRVIGMEAGADDYLVKPFSSRELLARVGAHLQMARLRREANEALAQSHARFEALFDAAPIGVYLVDSALRIRQVNPKALPVFGNIPNLQGSDLAQVLSKIWPQEHTEEILQRFKHTLETGEPYFVPESVQPRLDRKRLEYYEWQLHRISLPEGEHGVVCYFSDISRHVMARQELADADRRKDEFLAVLAHELRNPLAPIRNGLQLMKLARIGNEAVEQARTMMERQLSQMVRLIDDLMDVSRISRGKVMLQKNRVRLADVLQNAVETSRPIIEASDHELTLHLPDEPVFVDADETRLSQVFANLLNNAAKYTERGGRIRLNVEKQGGEAVITIQDSGIGIPPQMLPHVFDMFTQVDRSLEKAQGGLGIGLTIVKRLVEMHGGTIEACSEGHGGGSTFIVRLPIVLSLAGVSDRAPDRDVAGDSTRRRILVVDDNRDSAISLSMMLKLMGSETRTAHDGFEALEIAATFLPHVVLLDIGMPKLNGYDTARRIRQESWGRDMVLVAQTGWGQEEDKRMSHEAGFNFHLVKPVDPQSLEKLLAGLSGDATRSHVV